MILAFLLVALVQAAPAVGSGELDFGRTTRPFDVLLEVKGVGSKVDSVGSQVTVLARRFDATEIKMQALDNRIRGVENQQNRWMGGLGVLMIALTVAGGTLTVVFGWLLGQIRLRLKDIDRDLVHVRQVSAPTHPSAPTVPPPTP